MEQKLQTIYGISCISKSSSQSPKRVISFFDNYTKEVMNDIESKEKEKMCLIIHPESYGLFIWDIMLLLFLVLQGLYIPFVVCFSYTLEGFMMYMDVFITLCYLTDIILNFNTAYISKGAVIASRKKIARHYMKHWFFIDLLSSFPYDWLTDGFPITGQSSESESQLSGSQLLKLFRITKFVRVLRLIRFAKLKRTLLLIEENINSEFLSSAVVVLRMCLVVLYLAHWNACLWYMVGSSNEEFHPDSWLTDLLSNSELEFGIFELYVTCIYWSFTTMITVGYGDIHAISNDEKILCMFSMVLASAFFGYIIGSLTALIEQRNAEKNYFREILQGANNYMKKYKLPGELRYRIRSYFNYIQESSNKSTMVDSSVLESLSLPLREEISILTNGPILSKLSVFRDYFDGSAMSKLCLSMEEISLAPGDVIFKEGETSRNLYFLIDGTAVLYLESYNCNLNVMEPVSFFGEIAFFTGRPRTCSAKSESFIVLLSLPFIKAMNAISELIDAEKIYELFSEEQAEMLLSAMDINCFLCKQPGHIACECVELELKASLKISKKWLYDKKQKPIWKKAADSKPKKERHINKRFNPLGRSKVRKPTQFQNQIALFDDTNDNMFDHIPFTSPDFHQNSRPRAHGRIHSNVLRQILTIEDVS